MDVNEVLKLLNGDKKLDKKQKEKLDQWRGVYYGISLHTTGACPAFKDLATGRQITPSSYYGKEYQNLFDTHLMSRHPREDDDTRSWRYSQYRPLTKAPFGQIINVIAGTIFQDSNYSIEIPDTKDREYIWGNNFNGYDLCGYFANIGIKYMCEDPNGLFVRLPTAPNYEQKGEKVNVKIEFASTKNIVLFDDENLVFKNECEGYAYYLDLNTIWRFNYNSETKKYSLSGEDVNGYYAHMMGKLPVTVAGGIWNSQGFYDSFLDNAKAIADDFIATYSGFQMVDKEASHPFIIAQNEACGTCNGTRTEQIDCISCGGENYEDCTSCNHTGRRLVSCSDCKGTGKTNVHPGKWMLLEHDELKEGGVRIVSPDISINKHHKEKVEYLMEIMLKALHLYDTDKSESGNAKAIDQERLYKFISAISNHIFDKLITDSIYDTVSYRNVSVISNGVVPAKYPLSIIKPTQFQIETAADLLDKYKVSSESNMPLLIRQKIAEDFVDKAYSGDAVMKKKMSVVNALDTLSVYGADEILSLQAAMAITTEDAIFNRMLPKWLNEIIQDKDEQWFVKSPIAEIQKLVDEKKKSIKTTNALQDLTMQTLRQPDGQPAA